MGQTDTQLIQIWNTFLGSSEGSDVIECDWNGRILSDYIQENHAGITSHSALCRAMRDPQVLSRLRLKSNIKTEAEINAEVEQERHQKAVIEQSAMIERWLRDEAPLGMLINGRFDENDAILIRKLVVRNYNGVFSVEALRDAVKTLAPKLTYWDPSQGELRNQPAPPSRESKLSIQAKIDGGLIRPESQTVVSHTKDSKLVNPGDKLRPVIKKLLGGIDPDQQAAESIGVQGRNGRPDYGFNTKLKQAFANNPDGSVNWRATRKLRTDLADGYEKTKIRGY